MKKIFGLILSSLILVSSVFANTIPQNKELFVIVHDSLSDNELWTNAELKKADYMSDEYEIVAYSVGKNLIGFIKQEYYLSIKGNSDSYTLAILDMTSVACDKNGKRLSNATIMSNPKSTMEKMAESLSVAFEKKYSEMSDSEYEEKMNHIITNPDFIYDLYSNCSNLYAEKFIEKHNVIGKTVNTNIKASQIKEVEADESVLKFLEKYGGEKPDYLNYQYRLIGHTSKASVSFYSNNDKLITTKEGSMVNVSGFIYKINTEKTSGKFLGITIYE